MFMKNRISTLIAALALTTTAAQAQWTPDDKAYTIIGADSIYGQSSLKSVRMPDGKIVLIWRNTPKDMSYNDPAFGYYLYMQTFDSNGKAMLGKDGKVVSGKPTKSWVTAYSMAVTADNNILIANSDVRNDTENKQQANDYMYCFTPEGAPVWDKDGIEIKTEFPMLAGHTYSTLAPTVCVSGNNIYTAVATSDEYKVKADSTNWEPSPWFPDEEMPDSIDTYDGGYQFMRYNADGSKAWKTAINLVSDAAWTYPAPDGGLYILYVNSGFGLDARRIDTEGNDVWEKPVNIESGQIGTDSYTDAPTVVEDGKGGLMLAYRKLLNFGGYMVANHLSPDGSVYDDEFIIRGSQDGDSNNPVLAINGDRAFTAFNYYEYETQQLWVNQIATNGDYTIEGDSLLGYAYDSNEMWGLRPVKVIAQADGWVMLYGNLQGQDEANFYVVKFDFNGKEVWKRQIAEDNFKSTGFSVVNDESNAYIFYTCDMEIGDDWEEIPGEGGMRVMCVDITDGDTDGINGISADNNADGSHAIYNISGARIDNMAAPGLYIVKDNGKTRKVIRK